MTFTAPTPLSDDTVLADTRRWLERAVIGLNLCPFAKAVYVKNQVHLAVSAATDAAALRRDLRAELLALAAAPADERDTTLLMAPHGFADFLDFNDFLDEAEALLDELDLGGILQIAPFHPRFQFEGTEPDDIGNATNQSPYPTLHLLREESLDRAVEAYPDPEAIYQANIDTLHKLGAEGWRALNVGASTPASD